MSPYERQPKPRSWTRGRDEPADFAETQNQPIIVLVAFVYQTPSISVVFAILPFFGDLAQAATAPRVDLLHRAQHAQVP